MCVSKKIQTMPVILVVKLVCSKVIAIRTVCRVAKIKLFLFPREIKMEIVASVNAEMKHSKN
jgi:hypothetical protein